MAGGPLSNVTAPAPVFEVTARGQGQFPVVSGGPGGSRRLSVASVGLVLPLPPERVARAAREGRPGARALRAARQVLSGRLLEDALDEIARAWRGR